MSVQIENVGTNQNGKAKPIAKRSLLNYTLHKATMNDGQTSYYLSFSGQSKSILFYFIYLFFFSFALLEICVCKYKKKQKKHKKRVTKKNAKKKIPKQPHTYHTLKDHWQ